MGIEHWSDPGSEAEPGLSKRALHQDGVEPTAEFETDCLQYSHVAETEILVKANRWDVIAVAYYRNYLPAAAFLTCINQGR